MLVRIGDTRVGLLRREEGESWAFRTLPEYRQSNPRPVLGQVFEDDLERVWKSWVRLPQFFSNLLPEGPLRELVAREVGVHPDREGFLLARLGQDLPGAIVVEPEEGEHLLADETKLDEEGAPIEDGDDVGLKFSLAGVQLKLSALEDRRGLTVPASGQGGSWIVKLPLPHHPELPTVEHSILSWAAESGFDVPENRIVRVEEINELPVDWPVRSGEALAVRRFDRAPGSRRIHQEDFAQILNVYPNPAGKYRSANHEVLGRIILALTGIDGFIDYVRRVVFMVLSGNGDAHLKNWAVLYPDGRSARLTPLYDQVFTRAFLPDDALALNLGGERDFYRIDLEVLRRFARKVNTDPDLVVRAATETAERVREAWKRRGGDWPLDRRVRRELDAHLDRVRL